MVRPGGSIDLHGTQFKTWTRLAATIKGGTGALALQEEVDWSPGQLIVVSTSIWKDELFNQNEVHTIKTVANSKRLLQTEEPFQFFHFGCGSFWTTFTTRLVPYGYGAAHRYRAYREQD